MTTLARRQRRRRRFTPGFELKLTLPIVTTIYVTATILSGATMLFLHWCDPGRVVLPLTYPWHVHGGGVWAAIGHVWFIFAWGIGVTALLGVIRIRHGVPREGTPGRLFLSGIRKSTYAGVFEEIIYRWFAFYSALVLVAFFDIFFHLTHLSMEYIWLPAANFATLGTMHNLLYGPYGWMFGAAIVAASVNFRDAHENWLIKINAWFLGMIFFYVMFHYGLLAAICVHALYDIAVYTVAAICARWQPENPFRELGRAILSSLMSS